MAKSSEDVLMIVHNVKNKKCEGTLYMMAERMAWMPAAKDSFTVSHSYVDIKSQKISAATRDKVQLQVVLNNGANTFLFANPEGRDVQLKERDGVKELLIQLLPKCKRKINSELEEKNRLLAEDPELFQLYRTLVVGNIVSADQFWANRAQKTGQTSDESQQEVGVSAAFLADVKQLSDGCNGVQYNLTADVIESIFRTYPAVQRKHAECVPSHMTEQQFWLNFFQSAYYHRDRPVSSTSKGLFDDCTRIDEQAFQKELEKPLANPLINLKEMDDHCVGEGYGTSCVDVDTAPLSVNASLIRRFNQHSAMVLKSCERPRRRDKTENDGENQSNGEHLIETSASTTSTVTKADSIAVLTKKSLLKEQTEIYDLVSHSQEPVGPPLKLSKVDRYLHGPTPAVAMNYKTSENMLERCQALTQEILPWTPSLTQVLPSQVACGVLWELSPGGALMQGCTQQQLHEMIPADIQTEVRNCYVGLYELLRQFWSCFPVPKGEEAKVVHARQMLANYHTTKLAQLKEKLNSLHYTVDLTAHMESMLEAAYTKFGGWQSRSASKKT